MRVFASFSVDFVNFSSPSRNHFSTHKSSDFLRPCFHPNIFSGYSVSSDVTR